MQTRCAIFPLRDAITIRLTAQSNYNIMTLDQYIIHQKKHIGVFKKIYLEQKRVNTECDYPMDMEKRGWNKQFDILTGELL